MMVTSSLPAGIFQVIRATFDLPETAGKMASLAVESYFLSYFLSLPQVLNGTQIITSLDYFMT